MAKTLRRFVVFASIITSFTWGLLHYTVSHLLVPMSVEAAFIEKTGASGPHWLITIWQALSEGRTHQTANISPIPKPLTSPAASDGYLRAFGEPRAQPVSYTH